MNHISLSCLCPEKSEKGFSGFETLRRFIINSEKQKSAQIMSRLLFLQ